ncbi:MAG: metal-independent alpha-mannosidase [Bacteroidetes bacterium]|nr:metal-independent alpha-mannosidase [Bacteroidota bacterium]
MTSRREFLRTGGMALAGLMSRSIFAGSLSSSDATGLTYISKRPELGKRNFTSNAVEEIIQQTKSKIKNPKLAWLFENCYPNTLDTTVEFSMKNGLPDTFVITGDIEAMWLRDSSAQVFPYLPLASKDSQLSLMIEGIIRRQSWCINLDPYANAFNKGATGSEWKSDHTTMIPELHERKWEIDSLCYPIRLAYYYWKKTGNTAMFDTSWKNAMKRIYETFIEQQRKNGTMDSPYTFTRETDKQSDTVLNKGYGSPIKPVGLICSSFRPSDDSTLFSFLIPSNLFAVESLHQLAEILMKVTGDSAFAAKCTALANEVKAAVTKYGIVNHPKYGKVYAYEVDGFGGHVFMDDANVPNLLGLPYLCSFIKTTDPVYQNTRRYVLSSDNPYYFKGKAASGVGGPHVGLDWIWPMSFIMQALTSTNEQEIGKCLKTLVATDAETGFMHESFHKDDATKFSRPWFAWANTLFGELIIKIANEHKTLLSVK